MICISIFSLMFSLRRLMTWKILFKLIKCVMQFELPFSTLICYSLWTPSYTFLVINASWHRSLSPWFFFIVALKEYICVAIIFVWIYSARWEELFNCAFSTVVCITFYHLAVRSLIKKILPNVTPWRELRIAIVLVPISWELFMYYWISAPLLAVQIWSMLSWFRQ